MTDSVKGIFIWLVFLSHFKGYVEYTAWADVAGGKISSYLGQLIVTAFLFYSGYGVMEAIKKRGTDYILPFPKNRIGKTLLHFDLAVLLFLIMGIYFGKSFGIKRILLSLIGWDSLGNSNWYIFAVVILYAVTYLAFLVAKKIPLIVGVLLTTVMCVGYIIVMNFAKDGQTWWFDTVLCYPLGMFISLYKEKFFTVTAKNNALYLLSLILTGAFFGATYYGTRVLSGYADLVMHIVNAPAFCLLLSVVLIKFSVSHKLLEWCGKYTFELYILQRIPMALFSHFGVNSNIYFFFIASAVTTVMAAYLFRRCTDTLDKHIFR